MSQTVAADSPGSRQAVLGGRRPRAADLIAVSLLVIPVVAAVWLAVHGGGYTIDEWGMWAAVSALALAVALVAVPRPRLSWLQLLPCGGLFGLALLSLVSIHWAPWPQDALVEACRYLFYASVMTLGVVTLAHPGARSTVAGVVSGATGLIALAIAIGLWRNGAAASAFDSGRLVGSIGYGGGMAAATAIGVWPLAAFAADRAWPLPLRVAAAVGAGAGAALVIPTGARASLAALLLSGLVFVIVSPTPVRCLAVVAPAAAVLALRWHELNGAYAGAAGEGAVRVTGAAVLAVAASAGAAALVQALVDGRVVLDQRRRRAVAIAAALVAALAVASAFAVAARATHGHPGAWARARWERFQIEGNPYQGNADTRFTTVGGGRYDLWRSGVRIFRAHPYGGVGAGNFAYSYQIDGRSPAQPRQAHSQPIEVAATLGFVGLLLYVPVAVVPIGIAVRTRLRAAAPSERLLAAGIAAALVEFLVHSSIDWIWQISADALPALLLAAVAIAAAPRPAGARARPRLWTGASVAAAVAIVAAVALAVVPATLAQRYLLRSYTASTPEALRLADRAGGLDRLSSRPQIAIARAEYRVGDYSAALAAARRAVAIEPRFWVGWQMRSLAARMSGHRAEAVASMRMVQRLNPSLPLVLRFGPPPTLYDRY